MENNMQITLPNDLQEAIKQMISCGIEEALTVAEKQIKATPYLNKSEASKYLHISSATLIKWEKMFADIPTIEIEGVTRYRKQDLDQFMEKHKINQ